jgi:tetratricopeptide (TPR) repeat protein
MNPTHTATRRLLAITVVLLGGLGSVSVAAADSEATARKQAAKANRLAAQNKCKLAVPAFNRAYRTLKDPTLLFNRAECLRKLGESHDALRDYQLFLAEMPKAPNRAAVEERIAELLASAKAESVRGGAASTAVAAPPQPTEKPPAPAAKAAEKSTVTAGKEPTPAVPPVEQTPQPRSKDPAPAPPAAKAPAEPVHRAEKWTD